MSKNKRTKIVAALILIILLNSVIVLADVNQNEYKYVSIGLMVKGDSRFGLNDLKIENYLHFEIDSRTNEVIGDDIKDGKMTFDLNNDNLFIPDSRNIFESYDKNGDYEKYLLDQFARNYDKKYFIDLNRLEKSYSEKEVSFYKKETDNKLTFKLNLNRVSKIDIEDYLDYKIDMNLMNGIVKYNPEFKEYENIKKDIESQGGSIEDIFNNSRITELFLKSYELSLRNKYVNILEEIEIPYKNSDNEVIQKYLDKKHAVTLESKDGRNFKLIGYDVSDANTSYAKNGGMTTVSELEYDLIRFLGLDKYIFLKSNRNFLKLDRNSISENSIEYTKEKYSDIDSLKHSDLEGYEYIYEYDENQNKFLLVFTGKNLRNEKIDSDKAVLAKKIIDSNNFKIKRGTIEKTEGKEIVSLNSISDDEQYLILGMLLNESRGSNIISELSRGLTDKNNLTSLEAILESDLNSMAQELEDIKRNYSRYAYNESFVLMPEKFSFRAMFNDESNGNYRHRKELIDSQYESILEDLYGENSFAVKKIMDELIVYYALEDSGLLDEESINLNKLKSNEQSLNNMYSNFDIADIDKRLDDYRNLKENLKETNRENNKLETLSVEEYLGLSNDNLEKIAEINNRIIEINNNLEILDLINGLKTSLLNNEYVQEIDNILSLDNSNEFKSEKLDELLDKLENIVVDIESYKNIASLERDFKASKTINVFEKNRLISVENSDMQDYLKQVEEDNSLELQEKSNYIDDNLREILELEWVNGGEVIIKELFRAYEENNDLLAETNKVLKSDSKSVDKIDEKKNELLNIIKKGSGIRGEQLELKSLLEVAENYNKLNKYYDSENNVILQEADSFDLERDLIQMEMSLDTLDKYIVDKEQYEEILGVDSTKYKLAELMDLHSTISEDINNSRKHLLDEVTGKYGVELLNIFREIRERDLEELSKEEQDLDLINIEKNLRGMISDESFKYKNKAEGIALLINNFVSKDDRTKDDLKKIIYEFSKFESDVNNDLNTNPKYKFTNEKGEYKKIGTVKEAVAEMDYYLNKLEFGDRISLNFDNIKNPEYKYEYQLKDVRLAYMNLENNISDSMDGSLEYYRLPWIQYEMIDEIMEGYYNELNINHSVEKPSNLIYDKNNDEYKFWIFNKNVSYDGRIRDDLKVRVPSNIRMVIDKSNIENIFNSKLKLYGVEVLLDHIEVNGEKIYLNSSSNSNASLYQVSDGKLYLYQDTDTKNKVTGNVDNTGENIKLEDLKFIFKESDPSYKNIIVRHLSDGELIETYSYNAIAGLKHNIYPKARFIKKYDDKYLTYELDYSLNNLIDGKIPVETRIEDSKDKIININYKLISTDDKLEDESILVTDNKVDFFRGETIRLNTLKKEFWRLFMVIDRDNYYPRIGEQLGAKDGSINETKTMNLVKEDLILFKDLKTISGEINSAKAAWESVDEDDFDGHAETLEKRGYSAGEELYIIDNFIGGAAFPLPTNHVADRNLNYSVNHKFYKDDIKIDKEINRLIKQKNLYDISKEKWRYGKVDFNFSNIVFSNWDKYEASIKGLNDTKLDKIIIKEDVEKYLIDYKGNKREVIIENTRDKIVKNDSTLNKGELKIVGDENYFNFSKTNRDDWNEYLYNIVIKNSDRYDQDGALELDFKGNHDFDRKIYKDVNVDFEYHFSGTGDVPIPEDGTVNLLVKYLDENSGELLGERIFKGLSKGDFIDINSTKMDIDNYKYIRTSPKFNKLELKNGENIIEHYYGKDVEKLEQVKITYDGNGNTNGLAPVDSKSPYNMGDSVTILGSESLTKAGYSFKGWSKNKYGDSPEYNKGDMFRINHDTILYAIWEKDSSDGGRDKPDPKPEPKPEPKVDPEPSKPTDRRGREIGKIIEPKIEYELNKTDHFAYIKGYPDITVQPNGYITREEVAMVFYRLMETEYREEIETDKNNYIDVKADKWSTKAVSTLSKGEILKGYPDKTFKPNNNMTRAEISKVIARFTDTIVLETQMPDIIGHWAEDYINTVQNQGWINGYEDGTFKPDELLTRAEFVTMVNSLLDRKVKKEDITGSLKEFKDLSYAWYYEQMIEAINGHEYEGNRLSGETEMWTKLVDTQFPD